MVDSPKHNQKGTARQDQEVGGKAAAWESLKIGASTPYDFEAKNLTACGGLLPVITMLDRLGFRQLVD